MLVVPLSWAGSITAESIGVGTTPSSETGCKYMQMQRSVGRSAPQSKPGLATLVIAAECTLPILNEEKLMLSEITVISSG